MKSYQLMWVQCLQNAEDLKVRLADELLPLDKMMLLFYYNIFCKHNEKEIMFREFGRITGISSEVIKSEIAGLMAENEILLKNFIRDEKGILS